LGFHREVKGIQKNETVEVIEVESDRLLVRSERGAVRTLTKKQAKAFDVLERRTIEVAAGDQLVLTANRREERFRATNGEIVDVTRVDAAGRIHLNDGRILPSSFKQFAHGYAVTAHRSQGKSVDAVIISGDGMQKELFYVAASRGREQLLVITSDKDRLRESVAQSTARKSASGLARKQQSGLYQERLYPASRWPRFLEPAKRHEPPQESVEASRFVAQHTLGAEAVNTVQPAKPLASLADRLKELNNDTRGGPPSAVKDLGESLTAGEARIKKILGEQVKTLVAQTNSGIYMGEIIGQTDLHLLQRLSAHMVIAHVKDLLDSCPNIGSEVSIVYSGHTATVREIASREREKGLSR
jgi:hypothetical protein